MIGNKRISIVKNLLSAMDKRLPLLDIATGHGKFALMARSLGFNVTGVDAREERIPLNNDIIWYISDINDFDTSRYKLILCLGILYHFKNPQLLLNKTKHAITIIDTHYALKEEVSYMGMKGKFYTENNSANTASFKDDFSFWPTKPELIKLLKSNYNIVLEGEQYLEDRSFFLCL